MSDVLLSAISSGFLMVRFCKGPWLKNPQYLACSLCGAIFATLMLHLFWPAMDDSFFIGGAAGLCGSWAGMALFDAVLGMA